MYCTEQRRSHSRRVVQLSKTPLVELGNSFMRSAENPPGMADITANTALVMKTDRLWMRRPRSERRPWALRGWRLETTKRGREATWRAGGKRTEASERTRADQEERVRGSRTA